MARPPTPERVNLARSTVLLIDHNQKSLDMLSSIFQGFGVKQQIKCGSTVEASDVQDLMPWIAHAFAAEIAALAQAA